jgi:hypothetical protein
VFAIAVATSSVNEIKRASVSAGNGCSRCEATEIVPHKRPSTMIGVPIAERRPAARMPTPIGPEEVLKL